jgi:nitrogen fixation-related uncharacterized protein
MNHSRRKTLVTIAFAVIILVPSMLGFGAKFLEFIHTFRGESDGAFAITPMVNYLLASMGFFCMFIWAILNGMFRDLERPKEIMLERERLLDRMSAEYDDDLTESQHEPY